MLKKGFPQLLKKILMLIVAFIFCMTVTAGAQVVLKSGEVIEGNIVSQTDEEIEVNTGVGVIVTYYLDEIKSIDGKAVRHQQQPKPPPDATSNEIEKFKKIYPDTAVVSSVDGDVPVGPEVDYFADKQEAEKRVDYQAKVIKESVENLNKDFFKEISSIKNDLRLKIDRQTTRISEQFDVILTVFQIFPEQLILPFMASWMICALPMFFIAQKLKMPSPWLAAVPFLNFFMLTSMADKTVWWFLHFIYPITIMLIPYYVPVENPQLYFFLGYFVLLVNVFLIPVFLWKYIFYLLQIPGSLSLLTTLPVLNVLVLSYAGLPDKIQRMIKYSIFGRPKFGKNPNRPNIPTQSIGRF